jgi:hypothetical protein
MTKVESRVLCGPCRSDLTGPENHTDESVFSCPKCGQSETYGNILKEAHAYFKDSVARHLDGQMSKMARGTAGMTYSVASSAVAGSTKR